MNYLPTNILARINAQALYQNLTLVPSEVKELKDFIREYEIEKDRLQAQVEKLEKNLADTLRDVADFKQNAADQRAAYFKLDAAWSNSFLQLQEKLSEEIKLKTDAINKMNALKTELDAAQRLNQHYRETNSRVREESNKLKQTLAETTAPGQRTSRPFAVGDVAKLKTGSPNMTVNALYEEARVGLCWWWDGKINHLCLDEQCLVKVR